MTRTGRHLGGFEKRDVRRRVVERDFLAPVMCDDTVISAPRGGFPSGAESGSSGKVVCGALSSRLPVLTAQTNHSLGEREIHA